MISNAVYNSPLTFIKYEDINSHSLIHSNERNNSLTSFLLSSSLLQLGSSLDNFSYFPVRTSILLREKESSVKDSSDIKENDNPFLLAEYNYILSESNISSLKYSGSFERKSLTDLFLFRINKSKDYDSDSNSNYVPLFNDFKFNESEDLMKRIIKKNESLNNNQSLSSDITFNCKEKNNMNKEPDPYELEIKEYIFDKIYDTKSDILKQYNFNLLSLKENSLPVPSYFNSLKSCSLYLLTLINLITGEIKDYHYLKENLVNAKNSTIKINDPLFFILNLLSNHFKGLVDKTKICLQEKNLLIDEEVSELNNNNNSKSSSNMNGDSLVNLRNDKNQSLVELKKISEYSEGLILSPVIPLSDDVINLIKSIF